MVYLHQAAPLKRKHVLFFPSVLYVKWTFEGMSACREYIFYRSVLRDFSSFESPAAAPAVRSSPTQRIQFPTSTMDAGGQGTRGFRLHPGIALLLL